MSLIQYKELFNAFPQVTFPISVLASVTNQELVSYAWIFPNVVTNGHWWYSNTPAYIEHDAAARLEAVPQTKQIAYYSDAYKLEFILPKFAMYKRILAKILAERFVEGRGWSEEQAVELGRRRAAGERRAGVQYGVAAGVDRGVAGPPRRPRCSEHHGCRRDAPATPIGFGRDCRRTQINRVFPLSRKRLEIGRKFIENGSRSM